MSNAEHPIGTFTDWLAAGARPTDADYDHIVAQCVDEHTADIDAATLRRELRSAARDIRNFNRDGNAGEARRVARETTAVLASALGDLPAVDKSAGMTMRQVVENIPR